MERTFPAVAQPGTEEAGNLAFTGMSVERSRFAATGTPGPEEL